MATSKLKGVKLLTDETEGKRYVQIDLATLAKEPEAVEEYLDGLIAESRRNERGEIHASVNRKLQRTPESTVDLNHSPTTPIKVALAFNHRHAIPVQPIKHCVTSVGQLRTSTAYSGITAP